MSSRAEKERQKAQQEKFQAILSNLLKDDDNKYCVDCDAKGPRWASWNLGIFLCIRCAGIHRNLGVHISKVKSVNLDTWTPEQIAMMMEMGNSRARAVYEANLPDNYRRPQTDSALESFIRAKYETKKYIAKEWVPPSITVPKELVEDDREKKKSKTKTSGTVQLTAVPKSQTGSTSSSQPTVSKSVDSKPAQSANTKVNTPQPPKAPPPASSSNTADLIGLDAPSGPVQNNTNSLLGDFDDFMGSSIPPSTSSQPTQSTANPVTNGSIENNLFGESSSAVEQKATTKDSIMALYGGQQTQQQFGVPGGMYMPQQQVPQQVPQQNMAGMYGMNNMPMQQPMYGNQMGMMGMQQQGPMGNMGMPQGAMMRPNGNMGMYGAQQQPQMQQMQFQQMQQQMASMRLAQPGPMGGAGMMQNGIPAGQGWGGQPTGQTLSTNLWQ